MDVASLLTAAAQRGMWLLQQQADGAIQGGEAVSKDNGFKLQATRPVVKQIDGWKQHALWAGQ